MFALPLPPYNACSGRERRITSPSLSHHPKEQGLAAVDSIGQRGRSSKQQRRRGRSSDGREKEKETGRRRGRRRASEGGERSRLQSPVSERGDRDRRRMRRRGRESQSLPRDALRNYDDSDVEKGTVRGRKMERKSRSRSRGRGRKSRSEERARMMSEDEEEREEQQAPAVEAAVVDGHEEVEERVSLGSRRSEEDTILPIPSPKQKLPKPKQSWEAEAHNEKWYMVAEYRELRKEIELEGEQELQRSRVDDRGEDKETELNLAERDNNEYDDDALSGRIWMPLPSVAVIDPVSQRKPFSFLTSTLSIAQQGDDESESGGSQSDSSVSAASITGLSLTATRTSRRKATVLPGPWLMPSQQRVEEVVEGKERPGGQTGRGGGGRSAVS